MNPKNQHQLVIYYLKTWGNFSLKDLINDSMFFKFQTRLSEIEKLFGKIASRKQNEFTNRFQRKSNYYTYSSCVSKEKLIEIFKHYE